jgi:hypothetical protein
MSWGFLLQYEWQDEPGAIGLGGRGAGALRHDSKMEVGLRVFGKVECKVCILLNSVALTVVVGADNA